jgi:hypothetical protein
MAGEIDGSCLSLLLSPRPPSISCAIVRLPGHNLTTQMSYTLAERRLTSTDTSFQGYIDFEEGSLGEIVTLCFERHSNIGGHLSLVRAAPFGVHNWTLGPIR